MSVLLCQRLPKEHADGFRFLDTARVGVARRNRAWPGGLEGVHSAPNATRASGWILALFLLCAEQQPASDTGDDADECEPVQEGFKGHVGSLAESVETRFPG